MVIMRQTNTERGTRNAESLEPETENREPRTLTRIAVLMEGRVEYERNVLRGIRDFAAREPGWLIRLEPPGRSLAAFLRDWQPHGVLFQAAGLSRAALDAVKGGPWPAVHVSDSTAAVAGVPCVGMDNAAIGKLAADYFRERRFQRFAFVGQKGAGFSDRRGNAFGESLGAAGFAVERFDLDPRAEAPAEDRALLSWMRSLVTPLALFATHDECSLRLSTLCRDAGIRIPEDLALLGVDNDTLICDLAWPKLSSVAVPSRRVGLEAAGRLRDLLGGKSADSEPRLLPPSRVVTRHSTDVRRTEDEIVNHALAYLRDHLRRGVNVNELANGIGVSRRLLERKFRKTLGRAPLAEIQRLRLERAKALLLESDLSLASIAEQCGCADASQLVLRFRRETGMTPGQFRKRRNSG